MEMLTYYLLRYQSFAELAQGSPDVAFLFDTGTQSYMADSAIEPSSNATSAFSRARAGLLKDGIIGRPIILRFSPPLKSARDFVESLLNKARLDGTAAAIFAETMTRVEAEREAEEAKRAREAPDWPRKPSPGCAFPLGSASLGHHASCRGPGATGDGLCCPTIR